MARKIIALLLLALSVAFAVLPSYAATSEYSISLDTTTVEEDFAAAGFDPKSISEHGVALVTECHTGSKNYLYIYTYYWFDNLTYFVLKENTKNYYVGQKICSSSDGLFTKWRIDVSDLGYSLEHQRVYTISEIRGPGEYPVSCSVDKSYCFKGSHQGSNISVQVVSDTVLNLKAYPNVYRTSTSPKNNFIQDGLHNCWHTDVFSVYFLVPKEYEDKSQYEYLAAIRYSYYEQLWNAIVTDDTECLEQMKYGTNSSMEFKNFSSYNEKYPSIYINVKRGTGLLLPQIVGRSSYSINGHTSFLVQFPGQKKHDEIKNIYVDANWADEDLYIDLEEKLKNQDFACLDYTDKGAPAEQYINTIYFDETFTVESYAGNDPTWYQDIYSWLIGTKDEYQVDGTFDPIVKVDDSFFDGYDSNFEKWCGDHLVSKYKADEFKKLYDENKDDHSMYVFRFAQRDYYAAPAVIYETDLASIPDVNALYAEGTTFNDFTMISLTYRKDNVDYVVPVKMDPINVNGGITGSTDNIGEEVVNKIVGGFKKGAENVFDVIKIIIAVCLLIGLLFFIFQFVLPMFWAPKAWQLKTGEDPKKTIKDIEKRFEKERKK